MISYNRQKSREKIDTMMRDITTHIARSHAESMRAWEASGYRDTTAMDSAFMYMKKLILCHSFESIPWDYKYDDDNPIPEVEA